MNMERKIAISNRIYPIFFGLSADLVFFVAINTIFLTTVKHLSPAQISSLVTFSMLFSVLTYKLVIKIIKKIGNLNSIKLGVYMLLLSSILITFSNHYSLILIGYIIYNLAPLFKEMDSVILRENLKSLNKLDEYIKILNKGTLYYSLITMVISFISGFLFNINPYIPMLICIFFCIIVCILSHFIYEIKQEKKEIITKSKFKFSKGFMLLLITYSIIYSVIELSQTNTKLFLQYNMNEFLRLDKTVIYLSIIIALSRIIRVLGNYLFIRIYKKIGKKVPKVIVSLLIFSLFLVLLGGYINKGLLGIGITALGFFIFLGIRDPFQNYMRTTLLNRCRETHHEQAILYFNIFRKLGNFIISMIITCILLKLQLEYAILFLLITAVLSTILVRKINDLSRR